MDNNPEIRVTGENGRHESKRSYAAFLDYCQMGTARSLRKLLEKYLQDAERAPTTRITTMANWSKNFFWVERSSRFDELTQQRARDAYEAYWREKVMGSPETLGRLSEQARVSIADFVTIRLVPTALVVPLGNNADGDEDDDGAGTGAQAQGGFIQVAELNWDAIRANGHLVKSITNTRYGPRIELHDGQNALIQMGRHHKLFIDQSEVKSIAVQITSDDIAVAHEKAKAYEQALINGNAATNQA